MRDIAAGAGRAPHHIVRSCRPRHSQLTYFLNRSNHADPANTPLDYVSWHHYASCSNRSDPNTYTQFFDSVDATIPSVQQCVAIRDALSPGTKIDMDEVGDARASERV